MKKYKILLIGEFSNLHWTLAEGLKKLGHEVIVVSNGDGWKNYERDIDIKFKSFFEKIKFIFSFFLSRNYRGFDVVQLIGCSFLFSGSRTPWNKLFFIYLKKYNKKIFLGAFGDDFYYQNCCINKILKYSPYDTLSMNDPYTNEVFKSLIKLEKFNKYLATKTDGIIAGCYDYYKSYEFAGYVSKLVLIPFPINTDKIISKIEIQDPNKIKFFIGIQKRRSSWKGTDVLELELRKIKEFNSHVEIKIATDVPYSEYIKMYSDSDIIVDLLYTYSPGMNALTAMLQGKIVISGGEREMYKMIGEYELEPIINFNPHYSIGQQFLNVVKMSGDEILERKSKSIEFVKKHHDYKIVAQKYIDFWEN